MAYLQSINDKSWWELNSSELYKLNADDLMALCNTFRYSEDADKICQIQHIVKHHGFDKGFYRKVMHRYCKFNITEKSNWIDNQYDLSILGTLVVGLATGYVIGKILLH